MKNMAKWGGLLIATGIFCFIIGISVDSRELMREFSSDGGKTVAEFMPFFISTCGVAAIIIGTYFIVLNNKPMEKKMAKILEINQAVITVEFTDKTRKNLTNIGNIPVVIGDSGMVGFKGIILVEFIKE